MLIIWYPGMNVNGADPIAQRRVKSFEESHEAEGRISGMTRIPNFAQAFLWFYKKKTKQRFQNCRSGPRAKLHHKILLISHSPITPRVSAHSVCALKLVLRWVSDASWASESCSRCRQLSRCRLNFHGHGRQNFDRSCRCL